MNKKDGGTIVGWQLHTLSTSPDKFKEFDYEIDTDKCYILTGTIEDDPTGRFAPGYHFRSSLVVRIDLDTGIVETQNTVYKVKGPRGDNVLPYEDMGDAVMSIFY